MDEEESSPRPDNTSKNVSKEFQFRFKLPTCPFLMKQIESASTRPWSLEERSKIRPGTTRLLPPHQELLYKFMWEKISESNLINKQTLAEWNRQTTTMFHHVIFIYIRYILYIFNVVEAESPNTFSIFTLVSNFLRKWSRWPTLFRPKHSGKEHRSRPLISAIWISTGNIKWK